MLFTLTSEHLDFFAKHQYIEFEGLLSLQETAEMSLALDASLAKRLKASQGKLDFLKNADLFMQARNLWQEAPVIKKGVFRPKISDIAGALFKKKPLRLGYDHYWRTGVNNDSPFTENLSLQEISCYQPIAGGVVIRLSEESAKPSDKNYSPLPHKIGSGIFLGPNLRLSLSTFFQAPKLKFLLIVYCQEKALYTFTKNDLLTHAPKKEGLVFGDQVKNDTNPIIFR